MCAFSPEGQPYPGLHPKQRGQWFKGRDSVPLLHSGETPPGFLHPALELSAQGRHGAVGVGPEEATKMIKRAGAPLLRGRAERVGAVQPGEKKAAGRLYGSISVVKRGL